MRIVMDLLREMLPLDGLCTRPVSPVRLDILGRTLREILRLTRASLPKGLTLALCAVVALARSAFHCLTRLSRPNQTQE
jgi:hypothetical protein